jgi:hypothetical protein
VTVRSIPGASTSSTFFLSLPSVPGTTPDTSLHKPRQAYLPFLFASSVLFSDHQPTTAQHQPPDKSKSRNSYRYVQLLQACCSSLHWRHSTFCSSQQAAHHKPMPRQRSCGFHHANIQLCSSHHCTIAIARACSHSPIHSRQRKRSFGAYQLRDVRFR